MGMRYTLQAYRCTDIKVFQRALAAVAKTHGGTFSAANVPKDDKSTLRVGVGPKAIAVSYPRPIFPFHRDLSCALEGAPFMEARIQEGSHWDYSLYRGLQHLDQFSTYPQYWDDEEDPIGTLYASGWPEMLALVFGVPRERFERYLRQWYSDWDEDEEEFRTKLEGKAYPEDKNPYGSYEQLWDFLDSLGIHDPGSKECKKVHHWELVLPGK